MAIKRVIYPSTPTPVAGDWALIVNLMQTAFLGVGQAAQIDFSGGNVVEGAVFQIGGVVYLADADTAISGSASNYVKITPAGSTASASYVANLSGVTWDAAYGGYYDVSGNLYVFDEVAAIIAGTVASANTIFGRAYESILAGTGKELYGMDQNVKTTDSPTFAAVETGQGANELYPMDQAVRTTDTPEFARLGAGGAADGTKPMKVTGAAEVTGDLTLGGSLSVSDMGARTHSSGTVHSTNPEYLIPAGLYLYYMRAGTGGEGTLRVYADNTEVWQILAQVVDGNDNFASGMIISDGTNAKFQYEVDLGMAWTLIKLSE